MSRAATTLFISENIAYYEDIDREVSDENESDERYEAIDEVRMKVNDEIKSVSAEIDMSDNKCYGTIQPKRVVEGRVKYLLPIALTSVAIALLLFGWFLFLFDLFHHDNMYVCCLLCRLFIILDDHLSNYSGTSE